MFDILHRLFGIKKRKIIAKIDDSASVAMQELMKYYEQYKEKIALCNTLKEELISLKSRVYNFQEQKEVQLSTNHIKELQQKVDRVLDSLEQELQKLHTILTIQHKTEKKEVKFSSKIIDFVDRELCEPSVDVQFRKEYIMYLSEIKKLFFSIKKDSYGLFQILASELLLLQDIEKGRKETKEKFDASTKSKEHLQEKLIQSLRILELEIMRFGKYCLEEGEMVHVSSQWEEWKKLKTNINTLRALGLVYSEKEIHSYNLGIISAMLGSTEKRFYGFKGIGIIHPDNNVEFRFIKGEEEKHSEIVQILLKGIPGLRLNDSILIRTFLHSLPLDIINRIAGFEIQLNFDENHNLKIMNINYASTILEVQMERKKLNAECISISKKDFERLNYALLFSINPELLNKKAFQQTIDRVGSKIVVTDSRIYPIIS